MYSKKEKELGQLNFVKKKDFVDYITNSGIPSKIKSLGGKENSLFYKNLKEITSILEAESNNANMVSDKYHSMGELYDHRIANFIALIKAHRHNYDVWYSFYHSDGEEAFDGLIAGIGTTKGKQITYHMAREYEKELTSFATKLEKAPEYDGHTSDDVLVRLLEL